MKPSNSATCRDRTRMPAPTVPPPAPAPVVPKYANTEQKMSVILMALQGFDEAIEQRHLPRSDAHSRADRAATRSRARRAEIRQHRAQNVGDSDGAAGI